MHHTDFAIIGAGTSGCLAAHLLHTAGVDCLLIEKSRGLGGRAARRRLEDGSSLDIGAGFFDWGASPEIHTLFSALVEDGALTTWASRQASFSTPDSAIEIDYICGVPTLNQMHKTLANGIPLLPQTRISRIEQGLHGGWQLYDMQNTCVVRANKLIITSPAAQTLSLFKWPPSWHQLIETAATASLPQWVCAVQFDRNISADTSLFKGSDSVLEAAYNASSLPGHTCPTDTWVLQARYDWSHQMLSASPEWITHELATRLLNRIGTRAGYRSLTTHIWGLARHAVYSSPAHLSLWDESKQFGLCADWLGGGGITGAMQSARSLIERVNTGQKMPASTQRQVVNLP